MKMVEDPCVFIFILRLFVMQMLLARSRPLQEKTQQLTLASANLVSRETASLALASGLITASGTLVTQYQILDASILYSPSAVYAILGLQKGIYKV